MKKFTAIVAVAGVLMASAVFASETRVKVLENSMGYVSDSNEVYVFPNLYGEYPNQMGLNVNVVAPVVYNGYGYFGIGESGAVGLTFGKAYSNAGMYATNLVLDASMNAPMVTTILAPTSRAIIGYGNGTIGLGLEFANRNDASTVGGTDWNGGPAGVSVLTNYFGTGSNGQVLKDTKVQSSTGIKITPALGLGSLNIAIPVGIDMISNSEQRLIANSADSARLSETQNLKNLNAISSLGLNAKFTAKGDASDLVILANMGWGGMNLRSTRNIQNDKGTGLPEIIDQITGDEAFNYETANFGFAHVARFDKSKTLMVTGLNINNSWNQNTWSVYAAKGGAAGINEMNLVKAQEKSGYTLALPLTVGVEQEIVSWAKGRGMVTRNLYGYTSSLQRDPNYVGGSRTSEKSTETFSDAASGMLMAVGLGIDLGGMTWDNSIQGSFLGSTGALNNFFSQSSLTVKW
jgi:hypothetical protein